MHRALGAVLIALVVASCAQPQGSPETTVTIGTFNIEWLGDGEGDRKPRTDQDYLAIADIVIKSKADVLGVQEVENQAALDKILRYLEGYDGFVSTTGNKQQVGIIHRTDVEVTTIGEYAPLQLDRPERLRPGLVVACRKGAFDWVQMVVHLKSTSRYDSTKTLLDASRDIRRSQARVLRAWADSILDAGDEQDVLITGDINDYPQRTNNATLEALVESDRLLFLTKDLPSCRNPKWHLIDHVIASQHAAERLLDGSERVENPYAYLTEAQADRISDHCPVVVRFTTLGVDDD